METQELPYKKIEKIWLFNVSKDVAEKILFCLIINKAVRMVQIPAKLMKKAVLA